MTAIPMEAEALIARYELGTPRKVYAPLTIVSIVIGLLFVCVGGGVLVFIAAIALLPTIVSNATSSQNFPSPTLSPAPATDINPLSLFNTGFMCFAIAFALFALLFMVLGFLALIRAFRQRNERAVLCEHGVAYLKREGNEAFRWEQVELVLDDVHVSTSSTSQPGGFTSTSTTVHHRYIVVCKDGRRLKFAGLNGVEQLGQEIQIAVALSQKSA